MYVNSSCQAAQQIQPFAKPVATFSNGIKRIVLAFIVTTPRREHDASVAQQIEQRKFFSDPEDADREQHTGWRQLNLLCLAAT
jgi:hypothetical protein